MGKRPRVPHFITGIGDGNVNLADVRAAGRYNGIPHEGVSKNLRSDSASGTGSTSNIILTENISHLRNHGNNINNHNDHHNQLRSRNERLVRMEEPPMAAEHWKDVFGGNADGAGGVGVPSSPVVTSGPWQVSALALLGMIVIISAIFLHLVAESSSSGNSSSSESNHYTSPYARRRQRRLMYKERKKKTDEWSDDEEEESNNQNSVKPTGGLPGQGPAVTADGSGAVVVGGAIDPSTTSTSGGGGIGIGVTTSTTPNRSNTSASAAGAMVGGDAASGRTMAYPYYYHHHQTTPQAPHFHYDAPAPPPQQEHRHRRVGITAGSNKDPLTPPPPVMAGTTYYLPPPQPHSSMVPKYFSPSSNLKHLGQRSPHLPAATSTTTTTSSSSNNKGGQAAGAGTARRNVSASNSFASNTSGGAAPSSQGRLRLPTPPDPMETTPSYMMGTPTSGHSTSTSSTSGPLSQQYHPQQRLLPTPPEESQLLMPSVSTEQRLSTGLNARLLSGTSSNIPSFDSSIEDIVTPSASCEEHGSAGEAPLHPSSHHSSSMIINSSEHSVPFNQLPLSMSQRGAQNSVGSGSRHHQSLILTPGNAFDETPRVGNVRRMLNVDQLGAKMNDEHQHQVPHLPSRKDNDNINNGDVSRSDDLDGLASFLQSDMPQDIPFIPTLDSSLHPQSQHQQQQNSLLKGRNTPPRSILMDELKLIQMETGNSIHWGQEQQDGTPALPSPPISESFAGEVDEDSVMSSSSDASDISIPSGDPRKSIIHKRRSLIESTNASASLQSSIQFNELEFEDVIGGGGFGQVWKATWRGTPVAVKVLTGSAQAKHIAKAVLEEFRAEINLLKGMRHPNICLYMGACVDPPNRAIITELAANGSAWDALRLPLMPPFVPCDGTARGAWPKKLYFPDQQHGMPPTADSSLRLTAPIPPKGTWPWELVRRVACGAARGMAYLHSGDPPVLHRDLKSANLLLDESYTTKVCDFGLSRLKAQERSMTGNCGTVQWMAPEVLANMSYNEKADVYSFGIICWELLTRECPYDGMTAIQCALAVLNRDKRPEIPKWCPPSLHALIKACVKKEPTLRPTFTQIIQALDAMDK